MKQFGLEKLEKAIIYAERMAEGRAPYSNQPVENEVLNNPNVIRSMYFIKEVLQEVRDNGGVVGGKRSKKEPAKPFPFEVLKNFNYDGDKPISFVLRQFTELTSEPNVKIISAKNVNKWLAANGYITKAVTNDFGKENWIPTDKGSELGLIAEPRGEGEREYIRIEYNKEAQEFLAANLKRITEEIGNKVQNAPSPSTIQPKTVVDGQRGSREIAKDKPFVQEERYLQSAEKSCLNCRSYLKEDCAGLNGPCDEYEGVPFISEEEKKTWPTEMGPYVTGYGNRRKR